MPVAIIPTAIALYVQFYQIYTSYNVRSSHIILWFFIISPSKYFANEEITKQTLAKSYVILK